MNKIILPEEGRMTDERSQIHADQVRLLYDNAPLGMAATFVNAAVLAYVLRNLVAPPVLFSWLACLLLVTLLRAVHIRQYRIARPTAADERRWGAWFIAGLALSGVAWGASGLLLLPSGSMTHQVFIAFVLGGMVAGAAGTFSVIRTAFLAFSIPALAPLIIRFFSFGDEIHVAMGGMILLFSILVHVMAMHVHNVSLQSLRLRYENSSLVAFLAAAKERADALNEELRSEITGHIRTEEELSRHRDRLEVLVQERTAEWSIANARLQEEKAARDIAEGLRRQGEIYFRSLIENSTDLITVLDSTGIILFESPAVEKLQGFQHEELIGVNFFDYLHPDDRPAAQDAMGKLIAVPGSIASIEIRVRHKNGSWRIFDSIGKSTIDESRTVRLVINSRDNTDRKLLEKERLNRQKLESLGILAGDIAHDFNNLITGITANIELAKIHAPQDRELTAILGKAEQATLRAHDLTQQLLIFTRGGEPIKKTVMIGDLIREAAGFALRGSKAGCTYSLPEGLRPVDADLGQLRQVMYNMVINADQAMPQGGMLRISAENVSLDAQNSRALPAGQYVKIAIADNGIGIPKEHAARIFDPYFTTKETGSGLGLATSYTIIKKHGGDIVVDSEQGRGSTFTILLPASQQAAAPENKAGSTLVPGTGRILIMDDEEIIRDTAGRILQASGYDVESARDGREAVERYRSARDAGRPFSAVILDLTVPGGIGGRDALQILLQMDPAVKAIVSSGYSQDPVMTNYRDFGFLGVIVKPYRVHEMSEVVSKVMSMAP
ncbi:MAG: PAS domain S-box protein [Nitrospirae bacterium]|nr:PAS domain S-box protein [Nitrospirota bacterium]